MPAKKILVVDDEETTLTLVTNMLTEQGYEVDQAKAGEQAIEKAEQFFPDLILMDIVLPDMNGAEAVQTIHENPKTKDIKIIFFSGILDRKESDPDLHRIKAGNIYYDVLPKPINRNELLNKISRALI